MGDVTFAELARRLVVFAARYHAEGDDGWTLEASTFLLEMAAETSLRKPKMRAKIAARLADDPMIQIRGQRGLVSRLENRDPNTGDVMLRLKRARRLALFWALGKVTRG